MSAVVIENPVLNSPFDEPRRHFGFDDQGITSDIIEGRRRSSYFVPVPASKRSSGQLALAAEWTQDRLEENDFVNRVRGRVVRWRNGGYVGVTRTTRRLLDYWQSADRERKFFFCQIEAAETAIYLAESAVGTGDQWIENELRKYADEWNEGLYRIAFKMATGSGKTVLMAMLIAWQTLNKRAAPRDNRFHRRLPRGDARHHDPATACACCCRAIRGTTTRSATSCRPISLSGSGRRRSTSSTSTSSCRARRATPGNCTSKSSRPAGHPWASGTSRPRRRW